MPPVPSWSKEDVETALKLHRGRIGMTAEFLDIDPDTVHNYLKRWPDLKVMLSQLREKRLDIAEDVIEAAIAEFDLKAAMYFLDRQGKSRGYTPKVETEHSGGKTLELVHKIVTKRAKLPAEGESVDLGTNGAAGHTGRNGTNGKAGG